MPKKEHAHPAISSADQSLVLTQLEPDQLVKAKKHLIARRHLKGPELAILWSLRLYLLFMMAVVAYQVWTAAR
ncbi:MAG: hypothetical protein ABSF59_08870 [Candidatus Sulfotelmatobacter sp.]|jgi:hypothetical protein